MLHFGTGRCCSEVQCRPAVGYSALLGDRHLKTDVFESKTKAVPVHVVKAYGEIKIQLHPFLNLERGGGGQFHGPIYPSRSLVTIVSILSLCLSSEANIDKLQSSSLGNSRQNGRTSFFKSA